MPSGSGRWPTGRGYSEIGVECRDRAHDVFDCRSEMVRIRASLMFSVNWATLRTAGGSINLADLGRGLGLESSASRFVCGPQHSTTGSCRVFADRPGQHDVLSGAMTVREGRVSSRARVADRADVGMAAPEIATQVCQRYPHEALLSKAYPLALEFGFEAAHDASKKCAPVSVRSNLVFMFVLRPQAFGGTVKEGVYVLRHL